VKSWEGLATEDEYQALPGRFSLWVSGRWTMEVSMPYHARIERTHTTSADVQRKEVLPMLCIEVQHVQCNKLDMTGE
jgi:hypothetical protein